MNTITLFDLWHTVSVERSSVTAFADMTVPEVLELTEAHRREDPSISEIHEDRIASTRRQRFDQLWQIRVEHNLSRSYSTFDECRTEARDVFGGARIVRTSENTETVRPGEISSVVYGAGVVPIGDGGAAIEHQDNTTTEDFVAQAAAGLRSIKSSADKSQ